MIAETSSSGAGVSKATWNTNFFSYLSAQADVIAVVWFHINKEADWRINSSDTAASAFRTGLANRR